MVEHLHPALLVWSVLALPVSGISFLITFPSPMSTFHLFWMIMNLTGLVVLVTGIFHDYAEESSDWEEEQAVDQISSWTLIGLASLFAISLVLSVALGKISFSIDVPFNLYPLQQTPDVVVATPTYNFVSDVFGTWFSVVPGEENMKKTFMVLHTVYADTSLAEVPFALQPAMLLGNIVWSVEHVFRGQLPLVFAGTVFISGIGMDASTARTGTPLTGWLIHGMFNSILLFSSFLMGGFLTVIPS